MARSRPRHRTSVEPSSLEISLCSAPTMRPSATLSAGSSLARLSVINEVDLSGFVERIGVQIRGAPEKLMAFAVAYAPATSGYLPAMYP